MDRRGGTEIQPREIRRVKVGDREFKNKAEAARKHLIKPKLAHKRIGEEWTLKQALEIEERETKYHLKQKNFTFKGKEYQSGNALARAYGVRPSIFHSRYGAGWTVPQALGREPRIRKNVGSRGKPVDCDGRHFPTIRAFAIYYDLDEKTLLDNLGNWVGHPKKRPDW